MTVPKTMTVLLADGATEEWRLTCATVAGRGQRVALSALDGSEWTAEATDVFECVMVLRQQLEPRGIRLCCNGSRRDAWSSGMQRDMASGFITYICEGVPKGERPPDVPTLDHAPPPLIVTLDEQRAWHSAWLAARRTASDCSPWPPPDPGK